MNAPKEIDVGAKKLPNSALENEGRERLEPHEMETNRNRPLDKLVTFDDY